MSHPRRALASAPRIAVIVPAYGVAHLLGEALASLQAQTFVEWECVVVDDGAPDDVTGAVAPYLTDPRICFLATANHRLAGARNRAIAASSAPYVALLDGDDLFRSTYLERMSRRSTPIPTPASPPATPAYSARWRRSGSASLPSRAPATA